MKECVKDVIAEKIWKAYPALNLASAREVTGDVLTLFAQMLSVNKHVEVRNFGGFTWRRYKGITPKGLRYDTWKLKFRSQSIRPSVSEWDKSEEKKDE